MKAQVFSNRLSAVDYFTTEKFLSERSAANLYSFSEEETDVCYTNNKYSQVATLKYEKIIYHNPPMKTDQPLQSEKIVISAPMSFVGSAQRIWKITTTRNLWIKWLLLVPAALLLICGAWMIVLCWYFVMYVLFGILFIPYRLLRRGSRKNKRDKLRHQELLQAIEKQR